MKIKYIFFTALILLCLPMLSHADTLHNGRVCSVAKKPGLASCQAHVLTDASGKPLVSQDPRGFSPADLRGAYRLSGKADGNKVVAIVDAYDDPTIKNDLAVYSRKLGLSMLPDCKVAINK